MRLPASCVSVVEIIGLTPSSRNFLSVSHTSFLRFAGTDCGLGGRVHADLAWAKLRTLVEGARLASGPLALVKQARLGY